MFKSYAQQMQESMQQQRPAGPSPGANVMVKGVGFHPPGAEDPLLEDVSFHLKPNQLGLIIGRSGSGKTTLLQLLAGLTEQTSGDVFIHRPAAGDHTSGLFLPTHIEQRMQQVGGHAGGRICCQLLAGDVVVPAGSRLAGKSMLLLSALDRWCDRAQLLAHRHVPPAAVVACTTVCPDLS
jgi:ABC-type molybdenum transport system ATPase subunit/photorepair protein PhrA